jgi:C-terminal processing protease CtpA/Prc
MNLRSIGGLVLATMLAVTFTNRASAQSFQPIPPEFEGPTAFGRSRIGVQVQPMTSELREHFHAPPEKGLLVSRVDAERPAARAGITVGDILVEADGQALAKPFDLLRVVSRAPQGADLEIKVIREGQELTFHVQPEGEGMPWLDPDYWQKWAQRGLEKGSSELQKQLQELERRLKDLERKLDDMQNKPGGRDGEKT